MRRMIFSANGDDKDLIYEGIATMRVSAISSAIDFTTTTKT